MKSFVAKYKAEIIVSLLLLSVVILTIVYGAQLEKQGLAIRRWDWINLLLILPVVPLLFLQRAAALPPVNTINQKKGWLRAAGVGIIFGLLDLLVIKLVMHPEPYTSMPPFLQPFPYSIGLFSAGALEVELYYRMMPLTLLLLADRFLLKQKVRKPVIILLAIATCLAEPVMQFPDGAALWFIIYATVSGIAMNAWQFYCYLKYGFAASLAVRLGHYLVWHILLGVYVQYVELA
jgi:hypothetical protein